MKNTAIKNKAAIKISNKVAKICNKFAYDLEIAPNLLKCAAAILVELAKEIKGEISNERI